MCRAARAHVRAARLGARIRIFEGDSRRVGAVFPRDIRARVQAVTACQAANEMFGAGASGVVAWLRGIRKMLPGRALFVVDYYGRLGVDARGEDRETLLHDYLRLISGQGVPPARMSEWRAIYAAAGCRLAHVIEDTATTRFIHVVML